MTLHADKVQAAKKRKRLMKTVALDIFKNKYPDLLTVNLLSEELGSSKTYANTMVTALLKEDSIVLVDKRQGEHRAATYRFNLQDGIQKVTTHLCKDDEDIVQAKPTVKIPEHTALHNALFGLVKKTTEE